MPKCADAIHFFFVYKNREVDKIRILFNDIFDPKFFTKILVFFFEFKINLRAPGLFVDLLNGELALAAGNPAITF